MESDNHDFYRQSPYHCGICMTIGGMIERVKVTRKHPNSPQTWESYFPCMKSAEEYGEAFRKGGLYNEL
jgi:hypothetical protein